MAQQRSREGQQFGNYRLERLLGQGGFAEVYLGQHVRLKRLAAIKVLHAYLSEKEIDDFQREAQIITSLDHSNIVRIFDFDVQNGIPFLVMDYLPNGTPRQRHGRGEQLPLPVAVSYVKQVADALQYAHEQQLIHRDVKPENMLIGRRNEVVLSDFGIAAIAHSTSLLTAQASIGTAPYMAPGQIQAQARPASDQYALGIMVYEWLCGARPFEGSFTEIFAKQLMTPPLPLRQKVPTLSAEVEQVVLTALAKDHQRRFRSVQAFATALEDACRAPSKPPVVPALSPSSEPTKAGDTPVLQTPVSKENVNTPAAQSLPTVYPNPPLPPTTPVKQADVSTTGNIPAGQSLPPTVAVPAPVQTPYTYRGHSSGVLAIAWSPDGKRIASGSRDTTMQVWDAADGGNTYTYRGHSDNVTAVAWSPDGKRIASGSWDKTVQVGDAADGGNTYTYRGHSSGVNAVAWSPDGKRIASGSRDTTMQVWDAADGGNGYTYRGHSSLVYAVAWSPDGKRIASGSGDKTVQVWEAK